MNKKPVIGLIAMSGVRAQNPELLAAGLTLPGFIERSRVIASLPSLSLLTLAALTPPDFDVEYHEIADLKSLPNLPTYFCLVALTSLSAQIQDAYTVADHYRHQGIPVVMGGLHVTALPQEALAHATAVVVGEGEPVWPAVLQAFQNGTLGGIHRAETHGSFDLASSPIPRFDLLDPRRYNRITVQTSRGCPHRCEFCASSILLTPRYKVKPVEKVLEEVRAIRRIWPRPFIEFADDNSFVHQAHARELLRGLCREEIRWFTEADLRVASDPAVLELMHASGCQQVLIGLESPNRRNLGGLETRTNWKQKQHDHYRRAIDSIQSRGITVNGCFILGLDEDTPETFDEVFRFVRESGLYEVQITLLTPFPGTPLYQRLEREGRLLKPGAWDRCTLFDINFQPRNFTPAQLNQGFIELAQRLYSRMETDARRLLHRRRLRALAHQRAHPHEYPAAIRRHNSGCSTRQVPPSPRVAQAVPG